MTSEGKSTTEKWVEQQEAEYAYAYDSSGSLGRYFGVRGIPNAVLVDPSGTVVWQGHPASLTEGIIKKALVGAIKEPLWEWPAQTKKLRSYLKKNAYAKALEEAGKFEGPYSDLVAALVAGKLKAIKKSQAAGDFLGTQRGGELALKHLKGLPEGDEIAAILKELSANADAKRVIKGQKKLADVMDDVAKIQSKGKAKKMLAKLEDLCQDYPGTIIDRQARNAMAMIRERY